MSRIEAASLLAACALALLLALMPAQPAADQADVASASIRTPVPDRAAVQAAGRRALALVAVPDGLGFRLELRAAGAGDPRASTDLDRRLITVFVRAGDAPHRIAHDIAHEYGHAWDHVHMTPAARDAWLRSRGADGTPWWPVREADDYGTGAGDFAEVFAACRAASPDFRSRLAPAPDDPCAALPEAAGARR